MCFFPSHPLQSVLFSQRPRPELANKLALFGQFVGSWKLKVVNRPPDAPEWRASGEWHFGWVLDGRAIQDVWISPRCSDRVGEAVDEGDYGTTIRFYDPSIDAWRSTWMGPVKALVRPFIGRKVGDDIVLSGSFSPGVETRWRFTEIMPDSFHWLNEVSSDGWRTLRCQQEMFARRVTPPGSRTGTQLASGLSAALA